MKRSALIGMAILLLVWIWLAWVLLTTTGVNLKNIILLTMTAITIFVPMWRKYGPDKGK